jgi:esterase/lipase superfamily enzyme
MKLIATAALGGAGLLTVSYNNSLDRTKGPEKATEAVVESLDAAAESISSGGGAGAAPQFSPWSEEAGALRLEPPPSPLASAMPGHDEAQSLGSRAIDSPLLESGSPSLGSTAKAQGSDAGAALPRKKIDANGRTWVRVYFATDRTRLDLNGYWIYARLWLPSVMGAMLASMLFIGMFAGLRKSIACFGAIAALIMTVYFSHQAILGTQYVRILARSSNIAFGSTRLSSPSGSYPLQLGVSEVTLPPNHLPGKLERPSLLRFEWKEDDLKHVSLQKIDVLSDDDFFADLKAKQRESALVFIHGFNVRFDDALRRTAQLTSDLDYQGIPVLYSWPTSGKTVSYTEDEANVGWTVPHLEGFLLDLKRRANIQSIHVVAHSMGNRALLGVVERLGSRGEAQGPLLSRVVMAAPDVDSQEFHDRFSAGLQRIAVATTVYGSSHDRALQLSKSLHGNGRLGLVSEHFRSHANVEMIDTSPLDLSMLGHSYYGDIPIVIDDIKAFLGAQVTAGSRPWLRTEPGMAPSRIVWRFVPNTASNPSSIH